MSAGGFGVWRGIQVRLCCICAVGRFGGVSGYWGGWPLQGPSGLGSLDTGGKYRSRFYLSKILITTTDNELFYSFYFWLHPFHLHLKLNAFFEGGIFIVSVIVTTKPWL